MPDSRTSPQTAQATLGAAVVSPAHIRPPLPDLPRLGVFPAPGRFSTTGDRIINCVVCVMMWVVLTAVLLALLSLSGCASRGYITIDRPDGLRVTVRQPTQGVAPATAVIAADGSLTASTGNMQAQTPALVAAGQAWVLYLCGAGLILLGVVALGAKGTLWGAALGIPTTAGTTSMLAGGGLIVLAYAAISIPWWAYAAAAAVALVIIAPSWLATRKDKAAATGNQGGYPRHNRRDVTW